MSDLVRAVYLMGIGIAFVFVVQLIFYITIRVFTRFNKQEKAV